MRSQDFPAKLTVSEIWASASIHRQRLVAPPKIRTAVHFSGKGSERITMAIDCGQPRKGGFAVNASY